LAKVLEYHWIFAYWFVLYQNYTAKSFLLWILLACGLKAMQSYCSLNGKRTQQTEIQAARSHVVVSVGAGFGGLQAACKLAKAPVRGIRLITPYGKRCQEQSGENNR
jgi:hypothetical protein